MKSKKAVGLSISMIIMAVIALVVLFVVIAIFTNVTTTTSKNIGSCTAKGGECANLNGDCTDDDFPVKIIISGDECKDRKNICCLKFGN